MPHGSPFRHYMRRVDSENYNWEDIEEKFDGLLYLRASGLTTIGKSKNIYMEGYADSDRMRVYLPDRDSDYANESTQIVMTFIIIGNRDVRSSTIIEFSDYVRHGIHSYYDTARYLAFDFVVTDELQVSDEKWYGGQPYVEIEVKMQNLNGKTTYVAPDQFFET